MFIYQPGDAMRLLFYLAAFSFIFLFFTACGKDKKKPEDEGGEVGPASPVKGQWNSGCVGAEAPHGGQYYLSHVLKFSSSSYTLETEIFSEATCTDFLKKEYTVKKSGSLAKEALNSDFEEISAINDNVASYSIKPATPKNVELFNQSEVCGIKTWSASKFSAVTDKSCWNKRIFNRGVFFTSININNLDKKATMEFAVAGGEKTGRSPEARATEFTGQLIFTKK
jgi:hypothetical protein